MSIESHVPRIFTGAMMPATDNPVTLEGAFVRLEPLSMAHHAALCGSLLEDKLIWRWIFSQVRTPDEMRKFIEAALKGRDEGSVMPFATLYKPENRVVGTTRFYGLDKANHSVEIGTTIIGKNWQRTIVNTEAKYVMLRHAFEVLGCIRVQFMTDSLNTQSQNALLRLGARQEGTLYNHKICWDGRVRHSICFSIIDEDWPRIKVDLEAKLARLYPPLT